MIKRKGNIELENNIHTVDSLRKVLNEVSEHGYGDMKIKCQDGYLHNNEMTFDYINKNVIIHGFLFNQPVSKKVNEFYHGVQELYNQYWGKTEF